MTTFEKILLALAGFFVFLGTFDGSGWFHWLLPILIVFFISKFFSSMVKKVEEAPRNGLLERPAEFSSERKEVSAGIHFERLVSLLVKKGIVSEEELTHAGIFISPIIFAEKKEILENETMFENKHKDVLPVDKEQLVCEVEKSKELKQQDVYTTSPVTASENISEKKENKTETTEFQISGNMLVWVGVFAVLLGVGFFLKYTFENNIIGPTGRIILGIISGFFFLGIGEYLHEKYEKYANMLSGSGIGLLYLSFYGMLYFQKGDPIVALFFMGLVTATSLMLSIRYESKGIAVLGLIGGYGTPIFFREIAAGLGGFVLLNYLVILNIGVLTLAYFKNWTWVVWGGFIGTIVLMGGWLVSSFYDTTKITIAITYVTISWLLFTFATLIFYYFHNRIPKQSDAILLVVVGLHYAGTVYGLLVEVFSKKETFFGLIPLVLAFVYTGIAYLGTSLRSTERSLALYPLGMAVLFLTLVFPFEFDGKWLTVAWLSESAILGFVALSLRSLSLAKFAMPVYALGILFLIRDVLSVSTTAETMPIFNERFFLYGVAIVSAFCMMYAFVKLKKHLTDSALTKMIGGSEEIIEPMRGSEPYHNGLFIFANMLIGFVVFSEMFIFWRFTSDPLVHTFYPVFNVRFLLLLFVLVYAYGVMFFSLNKKGGSVNQFESRVTVAFFIANILVFISGISEFASYSRFPHEYHAILNGRTLIFAVLMMYFGVVSHFLYKGISGLFEPVHSTAKGMFGVFNLLFILWGIVEISAYSDAVSNSVIAFKYIFNVRTLILGVGITYTGGMSYFFKQRSKNNPDLIAWPSMFFIGTNILIALWGLFEFTSYYYYLGKDHLIYEPLFNVRAFVLLLMVGYTAVVSYLFYNREDKSGGSVGAGYFVSASVLVLFWGLLEIFDYHYRVLMVAGTTEALIQQASMYITGFLVLYGFVGLVIGLATRFALLRKISIVVLVIATIKVFLNDFVNLTEIYQIIAFLSLGIALLVVGYLSYRYKDRLGTITGFSEEHNEK